MTLFTVLEPPDGDPQRVAIVPEGFSWGALFLGFLWALWHRLWFVAALMFALTTAITVATNLTLLGSGLATLLQLGISLVFAWEGRALQVVSLQRAGYRANGLVRASSIDAAELAYFSERAPLAHQHASSSVRSANVDTLGIFGNV